MRIQVESHPLLSARALVTMFPAPIGELSPASEVNHLLGGLDAGPVTARSEPLRQAIRDLLRHGGYKPTGRGKPASEYLVKAVTDGQLSPINPAVDVCNAVSLHSGFPISVVDLSRCKPPFRIALAPAGASYVFNPSGQEIDLGGLLCLFDTEGPCANAVKDAQRTKTWEGTTETLSVIWGHRDYTEPLDSAVRLYVELLADYGAQALAAQTGS